MSSVTLGKYRLIAELGRGGMAEVFLAVSSSLSMSFSKLVVLKKLREHLADDVDFVTMLVDEARIAARLNHPNLVQTIEVGEAEGQYFLAMEYLDGQPLHRILARTRAAIPLAMHLRILVDVLAGINYAHDLKDYDGSPLQIVHRDVTPHNCFVTYEGQVKVVDFGIAKAVGRASETRHGVVKGKTAYMAPEQACGQRVDRRVDVFAVGVMIYEAAVRQRMWKGVSETDIIRRLVRGAIPSSPREIDPSVDPELDRICRRALAHALDDRYQTAADLQADLEAYLATTGPLPTARALGTRIAETFADKRATTDKIIESQLAHLRSDARLALTPMPKSSTSSSEMVASSTTTQATTQATTQVPSNGTTLKKEIASTPGQDTTTQPQKSGEDDHVRTLVMLRQSVRKKTRGLEPLILAAIGLATATAALTVLSFSTCKGPIAVQSSVTGKPITVTLKATPLETRFSIDDGPLQENPFIGQFPSDGKDHKIRAIAPGYPPTEKQVNFSEDISVRFTLSNKK
jgi:serine/threonine-protein kinase